MERNRAGFYDCFMNSQYTLYPNYESSKKSIKNRIFAKPAELSADDRFSIAAELKTRSFIYLSNNSMESIKKGKALMMEADRFCQCGTHYRLFECSHDLEQFRVPISCHSRICEKCGRSYFRKMKDSIETALKPVMEKKVRGYGIYLVTLTVNTSRYEDMPDRTDIKRFYDESAKFFKLFYGKYKAKFNSKGGVIEDQTRMEKIYLANGTYYKKKRKPTFRTNKAGNRVEEWRRFRGAGYIASVEVGKNNNLHCHAIVYAPYISQKKLSSDWRKITGDSFIVGIESVRQVKKAAWYVLKYIIKPPQTDSYLELCDYLEFIKGTRRIRAGGIFYGRVKKEEVEVDEFQCPFCNGRLESIGVVEGQDKGSHPLYKLLKENRGRGTPLALPSGKPITSPYDRVVAANLPKIDKDIHWFSDEVTVFYDSPRLQVMTKMLKYIDDYRMAT